MIKELVKASVILLIVSMGAACGGGGSSDPVPPVESPAPDPQPDPAPDPAPDPQPNPQPDSFSESELIESIIDNVYIPTFELFAQEAETLNSAIQAYCDSLPMDSENTLGTAQDRWKDTIDAWQMIELMQVGPLFDDGNALRNIVYSWPNNNACSVDQEILESETAPYSLTDVSNSRRGLDAIEYLLFDNDLNHKCTMPSDGLIAWNNRMDDDRMAARCNFASILAEDVVLQADQIVASWTGDMGYGNTLKSAGEQGSQFSTSLEGINDISDALFYFTGPMKDGKIATPVGLRANNCGLEPCTEDAESVFSDYSLENIITNMKALRMILIGGSDEDTGFIDFLNDVGDTETATNIITELDDAIALAEGFTSTYSEALTQETEEVIELHDEVNKVDDILKSDFLESLALELPATSAGDND